MGQVMFEYTELKTEVDDLKTMESDALFTLLEYAILSHANEEKCLIKTELFRRLEHDGSQN